jgi:hypothetical protein
MRAEAKIFKYTIFLTMIPLILSIGLIPSLASAQTNMGFGDSNMPPYKQMSQGALPHHVSCSEDKVLILRFTGHPACIKTLTADKWNSIGKVNPPSDCKSGMTFLENPDTGAIVCEDQNKVQKYTNQGWQTLDETPPMKTSISDCDSSDTKLKES